jgi:hypothetical protein
MITLSRRGATALFLDTPPDWSRGVQVAFTLDAGRETSLDNREARRPFALTPRVASMRFEVRAAGPGARSLAAGLRLGPAVPVLCPFWPAARPWAVRATSPIQGGLNAVWTADGSHVAVFDGSAPPQWPDASGWIPAAADVWAPALEACFPKAPTLRWLTDSLATAAVELAEDGPLSSALVVPSGSWAAGPAPSAAWSTPPDLLPFPVQWADAVAGATVVRFAREREGFGHSQSLTGYAQTPARRHEASILAMDEATVARLLAWHRDHAAAAAVWVSAGWSAARLVADVAPVDTALRVDTADGVAGGDRLLLTDASGRSAFVRAAATDVGIVRLEAPPGVGFAAAGSTVAPLILCRHEGATLNVDWTAPGLASARPSFVEVPPEIEPDASEAPGVTLGALPARAVLLEITVGGRTQGYTNHEDDLVFNGRRYAATAFSHGDIRESLNLERCEVAITFAEFDGMHPLAPLLNLSAEDRATVVLRWADVAPPAHLALERGGRLGFEAGGACIINAY